PGQRLDLVPPRRGRAGWILAVIQDHPGERAGPVRLGDHASHLVLEAAPEPVVAREPGAWSRLAGRFEPVRQDAFWAPLADPGDVRDQVPHELGPGVDHLLSGRRQPCHLAGDLAALGASHFLPFLSLASSMTLGAGTRAGRHPKVASGWNRKAST